MRDDLRPLQPLDPEAGALPGGHQPMVRAQWRDLPALLRLLRQTWTPTSEQTGKNAHPAHPGRPGQGPARGSSGSVLGLGLQLLGVRLLGRWFQPGRRSQAAALWVLRDAAGQAIGCTALSLVHPGGATQRWRRDHGAPPAPSSELPRVRRRLRRL